MATSYPLGGDVCWQRHEYAESIGPFSRPKGYRVAADLVQCGQSRTCMFQGSVRLPCTWLGVGIVLDGKCGSKQGRYQAVPYAHGAQDDGTLHWILAAVHHALRTGHYYGRQ